MSEINCSECRCSLFYCYGLRLRLFQKIKMKPVIGLQQLNKISYMCWPNQRMCRSVKAQIDDIRLLAVRLDSSSGSSGSMNTRGTRLHYYEVKLNPEIRAQKYLKLRVLFNSYTITMNSSFFPIPVRSLLEIWRFQISQPVRQEARLHFCQLATNSGCLDHGV